MKKGHATKAILDTAERRPTRNGRERVTIDVRVSIPVDGDGPYHVNGSPHGTVAGVIADFAEALGTMEYRLRRERQKAAA